MTVIRTEALATAFVVVVWRTQKQSLPPHCDTVISVAGADAALPVGLPCYAFGFRNA